MHASRGRLALLMLLIGLSLPTAVLACLWDQDTLRMERSRFPDVLELITGKFLRHSPEFYEWRIADRLKRLEADPGNVRWLDDLAVAYDKTGRHDLAVETALRTEEVSPGRYETAANLATFHIHAGRPDEGLPHLERALAINPDAHFGRERYQKRLVEYVRSRRPDFPPTLPVSEVTLYPSASPDSPTAREVESHEHTFAESLRTDAKTPLTSEENAAAVKGVLGMMRFGNYDSPVLLEALGSLLTEPYADRTADAKRLAARAYLKASYEVPEGPARTAYRALAGQSLGMQTEGPNQVRSISLETVEADFRQELADAEAWSQELRDKELTWIREGRDPEAEFDRLYGSTAAAPRVNSPDAGARGRSDWPATFSGGVWALAVVLTAGVGLVVFWKTRARRRPDERPAGPIPPAS